MKSTQSAKQSSHEGKRQRIAEAIAEQEYGEWMSVSDIVLYIQANYGLAMGRPSILTLARKFSILRKVGEGKGNVRYYIQLGPFTDIFEQAYFPDIPKGWYSSARLSKQFGIDYHHIPKWIHWKKIPGMKFLVGTREVYFAEEKAVRRYIARRKSGEGAGRFLGRKNFTFRKRKGWLVDKQRLGLDG